MNPPRRPRIAIATGDAGGIGAEISLKSALSPLVRNACCPLLVSDPILLERHAKANGLPTRFRVLERTDGYAWQADEIVVLDPHFVGARDIQLGEVSASSGGASLAFARAAIKAALAGTVDAVVAAPQNQRAIALALPVHLEAGARSGVDLLWGQHVRIVAEMVL